jgi:hypothetical protein
MPKQLPIKKGVTKLPPHSAPTSPLLSPRPLLSSSIFSLPSFIHAKDELKNNQLNITNPNPKRERSGTFDSTLTPKIESDKKTPVIKGLDDFYLPPSASSSNLSSPTALANSNPNPPVLANPNPPVLANSNPNLSKPSAMFITSLPSSLIINESLSSKSKNLNDNDGKSRNENDNVDKHNKSSRLQSVSFSNPSRYVYSYAYTHIYIHIHALI